jgi:hypothetical protein
VALCGRALASVGGSFKVVRYGGGWGSFGGAYPGCSFFGGRLQEVLRSILGVETRVVDFKRCFSRPLNLFPVSSCLESESDGRGVCFAVDCSALESLFSPLAAAASSVSSRKKKKGKIGISGWCDEASRAKSNVNWTGFMLGLPRNPIAEGKGSVSWA